MSKLTARFVTFPVCHSPFDTGIPRVGGFIIPKVRLAFLSGTMYYYLGGYDPNTGKEIWRHRLPAGGPATPSTYLGGDCR